MKFKTNRIIFISCVFLPKPVMGKDTQKFTSQDCKRLMLRESVKSPSSSLLNIGRNSFFDQEKAEILLGGDDLRKFNHDEESKINISIFDDICRDVSMELKRRMAYNEFGTDPN